MIQFSKLDKAVTPRIDEEGTDAHDLNLDRIPAVNAAQRLVQSAVTSLLEAKKFSGEALRDLNWTTVFQTSDKGQVQLDQDLGSIPDPNNPQNKTQHRVWSVVAVYPEFESYQPQNLLPMALPELSRARADIRFSRPLKAAKRLTQQQWADGTTDIFAPGSDLLTNPALKNYGYLFATRPLSDQGPTTRPVLTVTGLGPGRHLVAVSYLKVPAEVPPMPGGTMDPLYGGFQLEWPESMLELLVAVTCRMVTIKQGDGTTVNSLSSEEMNMLLAAIA